MGNVENTGKRDNSYSDLGRLLGIYTCDVDSLEYYYIDGQVTLAALIDHKHGNVKVLIHTSAIEAQKHLAKLLGLPFFVAVDYLDPALFPVPMVYVIPKNLKAREFMAAHGSEDIGCWMTPRTYAIFQRLLRGLPYTKQTAHLPNESKTYPLPRIAYT